jgi:hypothetical protein
MLLMTFVMNHQKVLKISVLTMVGEYLLLRKVLGIKVLLIFGQT